MHAVISQIVQATETAIATAVELIGAVNDQYYQGQQPQAILFARLRVRLAALPLDQERTNFYRNVVADCEALCAAGEPRAARWQLVQLIRQLRRFRDGWAAEQVQDQPASSSA